MSGDENLAELSGKIDQLSAQLDKHETVCDERWKHVDCRFDGLRDQLQSMDRSMKIQWGSFQWMFGLLATIVFGVLVKVIFF